MEKIQQMSIADKIILLNYIKKDYSTFYKYWTRDHVEWLEEIINSEIRELSKWTEI